VFDICSITFDTVFTAIKTANVKIVIYNQHLSYAKHDIILTKIIYRAY